MSNRRSLYFGLLGSFSYSDPENGRPAAEGTALQAGRKTRSFLQYLIVHHARVISSEELIREFWPEHDGSPADALRRMLCKIRQLLRAAFPGAEHFLKTLPGCYIWDPSIYLELDTELFEAACQEAGRQNGEKRKQLLLQAVSLYKGDFLAANDSGWTAGLRQYYRALYLDACRGVLPFLEKKQDWIQALGICEQAYRIDFAVEDFTVCAMRALIAMGHPEQAIEKYEAFQDKMVNELGMMPTAAAEQVLLLAEGLRKQHTGASDIFRLLCEDTGEARAFFCSFETFRSIVMLERRHLARSKGDSALVMAGLDSGAVPGTDMRRLERILSEGLRTLQSPPYLSYFPFDAAGRRKIGILLRPKRDGSLTAARYNGICTGKEATASCFGKECFPAAAERR